MGAATAIVCPTLLASSRLRSLAVVDDLLLTATRFRRALAMTTSEWGGVDRLRRGVARRRPA